MCMCKDEYYVMSYNACASMLTSQVIDIDLIFGRLKDLIVEHSRARDEQFGNLSRFNRSIGSFKITNV